MTEERVFEEQLHDLHLAGTNVVAGTQQGPSIDPHDDRPDYAAALYCVRGNLFQCMDRDTRGAWRLASRQARDAVYECARELARLSHEEDGGTGLEELSVLAKVPRLMHVHVGCMDTSLLAHVPRGIASLSLKCRGPVSKHLPLLTTFCALHTLCIDLDHLGDITPAPNLSPLAACVALHTLDLGCSYRAATASNLAALAQVSRLQKLDLLLSASHRNHGRFINLAPLSSSPALRSFSVSGDYCTVLLPAAPTGLLSLTCYCCRGLGNLACVSSCRSLRELRLFECIDVERLTSLVRWPLQELEVLLIENCFICWDLSGLACCPALRKLSLMGLNCVRACDLAPLATCKWLHTLTLTNEKQAQMIPEALRERTNPPLEVKLDAGENGPSKA